MKNHRLLLTIGFLTVVACAAIDTKPVAFLSAPKTIDELNVAKAMEACLSAFNEGNIERHIGFYATEAKIEWIQAKRVLSREEYRTILQSLGTKLGKLEMMKTRISVLPPDRSKVEGELRIKQNLDITTHQVSYDLIPYQDQWLIMDQKFPVKQ